MSSRSGRLAALAALLFAPGPPPAPWIPADSSCWPGRPPMSSRPRRRARAARSRSLPPSWSRCSSPRRPAPGWPPQPLGDAGARAPRLARADLPVPVARAGARGRGHPRAPRRILDEVEVLGARLKGATLTPATATAGATPRRFVELRPDPLPPRGGRTAVGSLGAGTSPPVPPTPAPPTGPEPRAAAPRATEESASPPAVGRVEQYRAARRLLREGLDRQTVRARTGLKLAEIELLRCHPGDES